ncbi:hypothetical protein ACFVJK_43385 [Streptomyces sp. NPDC127172]|uniref:hypothetical protein n=1 Tax=Streptomyces sp. NPDC127172 TaxID=3345382 RepID=UPI00363B1FD5
MKTAPLWSFADIRPSNVDKKSDPNETPVRLVNYTDVYYQKTITPELALMGATASDEHIARFGLHAGDIIITKDSETPDDIGIPAIVESSTEDMVCAYHLSLLRPYRERIHPKFLYWYLESDVAKGYWLNSAFGVTRVSISLGTVSRLPVPELDRETQIAIAEYLDREVGEIDSMIDKLDRLKAQLSTLHRTYLVGLGKRLTEAEAGDSINVGLMLTKQSRALREGDGVVTAFRDGQVALRSRRREDGFTVSFSEHGYQGVEPGDFVFHGLDGFAGAVGVSEDRGKVSPVYHVCTATALASERFMAWALRALSANGFLEAYASTVRQRSIDFRNWSTFAGLPVNYVSLDEQLRVADHLDDVSGRIDAMLAKVAELKSLLLERRSALITDVLTGRKEVA